MGRVLALPVLFFFFFLSHFPFSFAVDNTIRGTQNITDAGGSTLVLSSGRFVFGFFSPGTSTKRYMGIWYDFDTKTIVWVANPQEPLLDTSGILSIDTANGAVALYQNSTVKLVWSISRNVSADAVALTLLGTGNLVVNDATTGKPLWQSFDNPTNTLLPTMKMGLGLLKDKNLFIRAWRGDDDPFPSDNICAVDPRGLHEIYVRSNATTIGSGDGIRFRFGPWNGVHFSGIPKMSSYGVGLFKFMFVSNTTEVSYSFDVTSASTLSRLFMNPNGNFERLVWDSNRKIWNTFWTAPTDECDNYAKCGPNGLCFNEDPNLCKCFKGFDPSSPASWDLKVRDFHAGCKRNTQLNCSSGGSRDVGFLKVPGVKLPDVSFAALNITANLEDCRDACLRNCNCSAYAAANISNDTIPGCIMWLGDLIDTRTYATGGQDLYLKLPAFLLDQLQNKRGKKSLVKVIIIVLTIAVASLIAFLGWKIWTKRRNASMLEEGFLSQTNDDGTLGEVPLYDYATVAAATGNFCIENKIGHGGFGLIYKGVLKEGQEVAIKRLTRTNVDFEQGLQDFINEVKLIAKLQHRNLVRLLGCCVDRKERILVYEYMRNKSLDIFLFDKNKSSILDWSKRWDIISGIARGLIYLHRDSRLKVVHRDLKAANVLLDESMNAKISDFGTARIFESNQMQDVTARVVGTYGYIAPEYAMEGIISIKSDVFSFGVLSLEIVSGMKCRVRHSNDQRENLLEQAWTLWRDGNSLQLLDKTITCQNFTPQILRVIHVSLLCVQENPVDRPTMSSAVFMLESDTVILPEPNRPWVVKCKDASAKEGQSSSMNRLTLTQIEGR